jgi:hypothetical protein
MTDKQLKTLGSSVHDGPAYVSSLYNQYAAMLLGYILEVVKNMTVAEQYLIAVFKDVPHELEGISKLGGNEFCQLQLIARKKLTHFFVTVDECTTNDVKHIGIANSNNKYIGFMNNEQKLVFCGVYWHGKTISRLAAELEKTEDAIKKILKECFTTIRNSSR